MIKLPDIVVAVNAAFDYMNMGFAVYDGTFFDGASELEGEYFVVSEGLESEYAMVVSPVEGTEVVRTIAGNSRIPRTQYHVFYPVFEQGDPSVGLDDAWIIDFDETMPDFIGDSVTDATLHMVNWFQNREMTEAIAVALYDMERS